MAKYRNPRLEAELSEELEQETEQKILKEEPKSVDEQVWKQRYGDLRRHQAEKDAQVAAQIEEMRATINSLKTQSMKPPKSEEEIEAWKNAYPEFAEILETIVDSKVEGRLEQERPRYKELENTQEEIKREKALLALKKLHPNCESYFEDEKFHTWLLEQPKKHQAFIYNSTDVDDAALVLDKYELYLGMNRSNKEDNSDKDVSKNVKIRSEKSLPDNSGNYLFTESEIEAKSKKDPRWFEANEEKIFEAMRKGKILLDISGAAR